MSLSNGITCVIAAFSLWVFPSNLTQNTLSNFSTAVKPSVTRISFWKKVTCHLANCLHKFISMSNTEPTRFANLLFLFFSNLPWLHTWYTFLLAAGDGKNFSNCWHLSVSFVRSPYKIAIITTATAPTPALSLSFPLLIQVRGVWGAIKRIFRAIKIVL